MKRSFLPSRPAVALCVGWLLPLMLVLVIDTRAREQQRSPPVRSTSQNQAVRARVLGIPFDGTPGPLNAITDVAGVEVGHVTLISGEGKLEVGRGPVRTGVTAILPHGRDFTGRVFAARHNLNGNGEMTGASWLDESGGLGSPILLTNTHSVGVVRDAVIAWFNRRHHDNSYSGDISLPVVAE